MFTINNTSTSSNKEQIPSPFIRVKFTDSPNMVQVATQLRRAWITQPSLPNSPFFPSTAVEHDYVDHVFHEVLRSSSQYKNDKQWAAATRLDPEPGNIETSWREKIAYSYNHVFADTWRFLARIRDDIGVFTPPCDDLLPVPYSAEATKPWELKFEDNVLVYPAWMAPGVRLIWRMKGGLEGGFDGSNNDEIWWVEGGKRVKITIETTESSCKDGDVAAVLVLGQLCTNGHNDDTVIEATEEKEHGSTDQSGRYEEDVD